MDTTNARYKYRAYQTIKTNKLDLLEKDSDVKDFKHIQVLVVWHPRSRSVDDNCRYTPSI